MQQSAFAPNGDATANLAVSTTTARVALNPNSNAVRVYNAGSTTVFFKFGDANVTAATTDVPIPAGQTESFGKGRNGYIAAVVASGTSTLYITNGEGF